jgi:NADPH:quinone reductase
MRAAVIVEAGGPDVRLSDLEIPHARYGELLIRTAIASINYADVLMRDGMIASSKPPPLIPGLDVAGTVIGVGPGVSGFSTGDRVAAFCDGGAYAEYVTASASVSWRLPEAVDDRAGAAIPTAGVAAYNILLRAARLERGESVLVHSAAGGVGSMCVQVARWRGAGLIVGIVGEDWKKDFALSAGCDAVLDHREPSLEQSVRSIAPEGIDIVLDATGSSWIDFNLDCLANFGRLVIYGHTGRQAGTVKTTALNATNRSVIGYSTTGYARARPDIVGSAGRAMIQAIRRGNVRFSFGETFPLEGAGEALRWLESRRSVGKLLIEVNAIGSPIA